MLARGTRGTNVSIHNAGYLDISQALPHACMPVYLALQQRTVLKPMITDKQCWPKAARLWPQQRAVLILPLTQPASQPGLYTVVHQVIVGLQRAWTCQLVCLPSACWSASSGGS